MESNIATSWAERKRAALRAEIIDAAFAEFAERGYHQTGIADIAKRLGIGHGTFYNHFANKREILEHVVDELVDKITAALEAENAPEAATTLDEYRAQAHRIAEALTAIIEADPRVARMLLLEATSIDAEMTARLLGLLEQGAIVSAAYLRNGVERGFLRPDLDVEVTAEAVVGMILAGALRSLRTPLDLDDRRRFDEGIIRLLTEGIAAR
jgi:AcrR family transcriptional regulator